MSVRKETYWRVAEAEKNITGRNFCQQCQSRQVIKGGQWKPTDNGMRRRWWCAGCLQRAKERREGKVVG